MNTLSVRQKKHLRALGHDLKPVVCVGRHGLSEAVEKDIDRAMNDHELIKVRFVDCKDERRDISRIIAERTGAALLGVKGHVALYFRRSELAQKQRIVLPQ